METKEFERKNQMEDLLRRQKELEDLKIARQKELEDLKIARQKEMEDLARQKELDDLAKQKEMEDLNLAKQKELEDLKIARQKELDDFNLAKQKELEDLARQKELDDFNLAQQKLVDDIEPQPNDTKGDFSNNPSMVNSYITNLANNSAANINIGMNFGDNTAYDMGSHLFGQKSKIINQQSFVQPKVDQEANPLDLDAQFTAFGINSGENNILNIQSGFFEPTDFTNAQKLNVSIPQNNQSNNNFNNQQNPTDGPQPETVEEDNYDIPMIDAVNVSNADYEGKKNSVLDQQFNNNTPKIQVNNNTIIKKPNAQPETIEEDNYDIPMIDAVNVSNTGYEDKKNSVLEIKPNPQQNDQANDNMMISYSDQNNQHGVPNNQQNQQQ